MVVIGTRLQTSKSYHYYSEKLYAHIGTYSFAELFNEIFFVCKASWSSSFFSFFPHFSFFVNYYLVVEI